MSVIYAEEQSLFEPSLQVGGRHASAELEPFLMKMKSANGYEVVMVHAMSWQ